MDVTVHLLRVLFSLKDIFVCMGKKRVIFGLNPFPTYSKLTLDMQFKQFFLTESGNRFLNDFIKYNFMVPLLLLFSENHFFFAEFLYIIIFLCMSTTNKYVDDTCRR